MPSKAGFVQLYLLFWAIATSSAIARISKGPTPICELNDLLTEVVANQDLSQAVQLAEPVEASVCLVNATCLEANIHFPVDRLLLKDVALTLLQATKLIRQRGLVRRMPESPEELARDMNRLCIEMTHSRRRDRQLRLSQERAGAAKACLKRRDFDQKKAR